ncbi:MAG: regulatory protein RecX [Balneolaceae bacterium]|nr:MAG: regulatory protein RecX [Balneolaceae bacterium]
MKQDSNHILEKLPLEITEIQVQKNNGSRVSLFSNKEFLFGISIKTRFDFSLEKGVELTPFLFKQILLAEEYEAAKSSGLRYLERRDHTSFEIRNKLRKKGFDESIIDKVIDELFIKNYLNDTVFAFNYSTEKANIHQWGPEKIKAALYQKGLKREIVQESIKKIEENLPQVQICVDLALKRKKHFLREQDPIKRKQKIYNYLAGRGFSGTAIVKSLTVITAQLDV